MLHVHSCLLGDLLRTRQNLVRTFRRDAKHHRPRFYVQPVFHPANNNERENAQHHHENGDLVQPSSGRHSHRRHHPDGRSRSQAGNVSPVSQDRPGADETDSLHHVRRDARRPRVPDQPSDFAASNRKQPPPHPTTHPPPPPPTLPT